MSSKDHLRSARHRGMTIGEINIDVNRRLLKKMPSAYEKFEMIDYTRAKCLICETVVNLTIKVDTSNLVRHFTSWHNTAHDCSLSWNKAVDEAPSTSVELRPLSTDDFDVISESMIAAHNCQCLICGEHTDRSMLTTHFIANHRDMVAVPRCRLCIDEIFLSAHFSFQHRPYTIVVAKSSQYGFSFRLPSHDHQSRIFSSEKTLSANIRSTIMKLTTGTSLHETETEHQESRNDIEVSNLFNTGNALGKHGQMKRRKINPIYRQVKPLEFKSPLFYMKDDCIICVICQESILGAVLSSSIICHFKTNHPAEVNTVKMHLIKVRLRSLSRGSMSMLSHNEYVCHECADRSYKLHRDFNLSRAIDHMKKRHAHLLPEYIELENNDEPPVLDEMSVADERRKNEQNNSSSKNDSLITVERFCETN